MEQIIKKLCAGADSPWSCASVGDGWGADQNLQRIAEPVLEEVVMVIEVPKFSFQDHIPRRVSLPVLQMVDELVEVPQISLQDCCGGAAHGSALHRCSDEFVDFSDKQIVDILVP